MADEPRDPVADHAALQGKRVALGVVIVASVVFIAATAIRVIPAVFGVWVVPLPAGAPGSAACAAGLRDLEQRLERDDPASPSRGEKAEEGEATREACSLTPEGLQAWASLERLQVAGRQLKGRDPAALAQLRRDLAAHLPSDLR
jgi:hypothetical protein